MILAAVSLLITSSTLVAGGIVMRVYRPKVALERNLPMLEDSDRRDLSSTIFVEEEERSTTTIFATTTWNSSCKMPNRM